MADTNVLAPRAGPRVRSLDAGEDLEQRRLTRSIGTDEPDVVSLVQGERQPLEKRRPPERLHNAFATEEDWTGHPSMRPRSAFTRPRLILPLNRLSFEPRVAFVGRRARGTTAAAAIIARRRARASSRFFSRLRWLCALITTTPSALIRWSFIPSSRSLTISGRDEARMLKRRWTALETLLTFWPPAPCARMASISTSLSRSVMEGASRGMIPLPRPGPLHRGLTQEPGLTMDPPRPVPPASGRRGSGPCRGHEEVEHQPSLTSLKWGTALYLVAGQTARTCVPAWIPDRQPLAPPRARLLRRCGAHRGAPHREDDSPRGLLSRGGDGGPVRGRRRGRARSSVRSHEPQSKFRNTPGQPHPQQDPHYYEGWVTGRGRRGSPSWTVPHR